MTHIGSIKDIIQTGSIGEENIYPGIHLLGASLLDITKLNVQALANLLFVSWSIIYLLGTYLLATVISSRRGQVLLITAFASPLVFSHFHTTIHPSYYSLFMTPLLLYFIHRRENLQTGQTANTLIIIVLSLAMVIAHPMTALFVISILLAFNIAKFLYQRIINRQEPAGKNTGIPGDLTILIMICAFFSLWYFVANDFLYIAGSIVQAYDILFLGLGETPLEEQSSRMTESGITIYQIIELFIYRYGAIFIYGIVSVIAVALTVGTFLRRKAQLEPLHFTYAIVFMLALAISVISLLAFNLERELARISRFFLMVAPLISGLVVYEFMCRGKWQMVRFRSLKIKRNVFVGLITILIVGVCTLSIFNVYGSPRTVIWNGQITRMGIDGSVWFLGHRNEAMEIVTDNVAVGRFDDFNFGAKGQPFAGTDWIPPIVSSHFGNDTTSSITDTLVTYTFWNTAGPSAYLLTSEFGRIEILYHEPSVRYSHPQYTQTDYVKLREDPKIAQIYSNNEFEVWYCILESTDE